MLLYCMTLLSVTGAHVVAAGLSRKVGYTLRQLDASGKKVFYRCRYKKTGRGFILTLGNK